MKKLLPVIFAVIGIGVGLGAGIMLRPEPEISAATEVDADAHAEAEAGLSEVPPIAGEINESLDYMKLSDQFIVPVVKDGKMRSLVLVSLALETQPGVQEKIINNEPRLRGALLQVMFDYANVGGFDGAFTNSSRLMKLRRNFFEVAQSIFGDDITDVIVVEITRQDLS
ncbi:flagellar basal body-associated protein FliL [Shimia sp. Alg240-R146]|uniref:flagellar basal body-associated protein FliL n=1 Tax=Shimia sp. Alg240-R146 TaxID=2993449 RepID=UPI0022E5BA6D|nr:flagellar basal body-associated protein FliL [Shimia sp. Alg240-R146]